MPYADMIITGGSIFTGIEYREDLDFVALKGNKIIATGSPKDMNQYRGTSTKIYEYTKDQLIMPGLHDNHIHLIQAGMVIKYVDLSETKSAEEAATIISNFIHKNPVQKSDEWIIGIGWSKYKFGFNNLPKKETLDALIPDIPVFLLDDELHSAWTNSTGLIKAEITENTPDPPFGEIQRDKNGHATGYLYETALALVGKKAFNFSNAQVEDLAVTYMNQALKYGITSITDMTPYLSLDLSYTDTYFNMAINDKLPVRINAALDLFEDIKKNSKLMKKAEIQGKGMYRIPFLKQFVDGVLGNHTAMLQKDYSDQPGINGCPLLNLHQLNEAIVDAHKNNMSVRLHACGDSAVKAALDGFEKAIEKYGKKKNVHHQIEHIEVIDPSDIHRFTELGIVASVQPEHIVSGMPSFSDNNYPNLLGSKRTKYTWPFRQLINADVILAGGSDCPVVTGNPFTGIYVGLERLHDDGTPQGGWNPNEKLTIKELLQMYTYNAAFGEGRIDELGTLDVGKLADVTVIDRNLFSVPTREVLNAKALLTISDGKVRYEAG